MTNQLELAGQGPAHTTRKHALRTVRNGVIGAAMAALAFGALSTAARADSSNGSTVAHVAVASGISLTGLSSSFTLNGAPGSAATGVAAVGFNVETNNVAGYAVTVQSQAATLLPGNTILNTDSIPVSALTVRPSGSGLYQALSSSAAVTVHSKSSRSANGGDTLSDDYRMNIPVVNPDTYSTTLDYIASTL